MKRLLIQTQLSNYDSVGKFILECDSGWNMAINRAREMLKLNPEFHIDIMGPRTSPHKHESQVITHPRDVNPDLWEKYGPEGEGRLSYIGHKIIPNALATRYDFDFEGIARILRLKEHKNDASLRYDAIYINDPMLHRNFKALFFVKAGYVPKLFVHSHFIDDPNCPKFPKEASLWLGQCEAAIKADFNFWQCESSMEVFFKEFAEFYMPTVVQYVREKSLPWDDGYSTEEINTPVNMKNVRFDPKVFDGWRKQGKKVIFVPNRIGGRGRSSDYTNCGKFMFDILPELWKRNGNFVVLAGNPNQKFFNHELEKECGPHGYVSLVPDAFTRDEFKFVAKNSDIAVGLYDQDSYGGTVARECIDLGCVPLWLDNFEYSSIAREAGDWPYLVKPDFSDIVVKTSFLLTALKIGDPEQFVKWKKKFRDVVLKRCSYESTTPKAMEKMGLL